MTEPRKIAGFNFVTAAEAARVAIAIKCGMPVKRRKASRKTLKK